MPLPNMPPCPDSLKTIQHFLTIASEHDSRDPVVSYWCRLNALQQGLKIDKSSPEAKKLLFFLMDWLEAEKAKQKDNEAIIHEIPAQAHLENYALKLFLWADQQDRAAVFNKNVVKAFYTAGMIYSCLEIFGELTEEVAKNQKYAKWKAAYIHNCLKNGETPVPGPMGGEQDEEDEGVNMPSASDEVPAPSNAFNLPNIPSQGFSSAPNIPSQGVPSFPGGPSQGFPSVPGGPTEGFLGGPNIPSQGFPTSPSGSTTGGSALPSGGGPGGPLPFNIPPTAEDKSSNDGKVNPEVVARAQKLCKFATSALNYDDVATAVSNLKKALLLLTTGREE